MAAYLENYGLDFFAEEEDMFSGLLGYLAQNGKAIVGYYNYPYLFKSMGNVEFWLDTELDPENKRLSVTDFDAHCGGNVVWEMIASGNDINSKQDSPLKRIMLFKACEGQRCLIPVHVITADVLPSFLEGDVIKLQMIAQPLEINYYADEDEYSDSLPSDEYGKKWGIGEGSLLALSFLNNHDPERYDKTKEYESDSYLHFNATVTKLYHGVFDMGGKKENLFVRCFAQTAYGELEFDHTIDQVPEEQRKNMKVGAVISGLCILSGDAAIDEYENGVIKDFEHDLKALRYAFVKGQAQRLRSVLSPNAVLDTDNADTTFVGPDQIIERINYVHDNYKKEYFAHLATVTEAEDLEFSVGERCLILARESEDNYESLAFIKVNDDGLITDIIIRNESRYRFQVDRPATIDSDPEEFQPHKRVEEPIFLRAQFHGIIDHSMELEELLNNIADRETSENNAKLILDALQKEPQPDIETALENTFGYLFAKAVEQALSNELSKSAGSEEVTVSIVPKDAFSGEVNTILSELKKPIEKAFRLGKQFYKDLKYYMQSKDLGEDDFAEEFTRAAVVVQRSGQLGASIFREQH